MNRLTRAALGGTQYREPVTLTHPATKEQFIVEVRPLSDGEAQQVQSIQLGAMGFESTPEEMKAGSMKVRGDMAKITGAQAEARRTAVSMAVVGDETWTPEELAAVWPPGWVEEVAKVVYRISGIEVPSAEIRNFRSIKGGAAAPHPHGRAGDTAGQDD